MEVSKYCNRESSTQAQADMNMLETFTIPLFELLKDCLPALNERVTTFREICTNIRERAHLVNNCDLASLAKAGI